MTGWGATNTESADIQEAGSTIRISNANNALDGDNLYWIAPAPYLGRKVSFESDWHILGFKCDNTVI